GSAERKQHAERNGPQTPRVLCPGNSAFLASRSQGKNRGGVHLADRVDRLASRPNTRRRGSAAGVQAQSKWHLRRVIGAAMSKMAYPEKLPIKPLRHPPSGMISVPGSKSITNRALTLAALNSKTCDIWNPLQS